MSRKTTAEYTTDYTYLGPNDFFSKQMNIPKEALANIFNTWKSALESFLQCNYVKHDALVGENACHIRAFAIHDFSKLKSKDSSFFSTLNKTISELSRITSNILNITIEKQDQVNSVETFLKKNNLTFSLPMRFFFQIKYIIDSYLLTLTKVSFPTTELTLREKTSYQPIRDLGFAYNRAQYLIHNTQKNLSASSCDYIIAESEALNDNGLNQLLMIKNDSHGRCSIPQFFTAKVLFKRALKKENHLLFKITRHLKKNPIDYLVLQFKPNLEQNDFEIYSDAVLNNSIIVIEGVVNYEKLPEKLEEYKSRLLSKSIMTVILANFAAHPQYSGDLKHLPPPFNEAISLLQKSADPHLCSYESTIEDIRLEEKTYIHHKSFAEKEGCSLDNPSLLFINHMYCDLAYKYSSYFENPIIKIEESRYSTE